MQSSLDTYVEPDTTIVLLVKSVDRFEMVSPRAA